MIVRRFKPLDPLCERCLKLTKIECAVVAFELSCTYDYFREAAIVSLCQQCADIVERDGGEIIGCNVHGLPLDPMHPWNCG